MDSIRTRGVVVIALLAAGVLTYAAGGRFTPLLSIKDPAGQPALR